MAYHQKILHPWSPFSCSSDEGHVRGSKKARLMRAVKVVRVHATAITALVTPGNYIATGDAGGFVRFFDARLGLTAWFEELNAGILWYRERHSTALHGYSDKPIVKTAICHSFPGPITSLSFSAMDPLKHNDALYALQVAPFLVGTRDAHLILLRAAIFELQPGSLDCKVQAQF